MALSIRQRLTLWYSAVLLLGLIGFGTGMYMLLQQRLLAGVDASLQQRIQGLKTTLDLEGKLTIEQLRLEVSEFASEIPEGSLMLLTDEHGVVLLPSWLSRLPEGFHTISHDGRPYRTLAAGFESGGTKYFATVASDPHDLLAAMNDFRRFLFLTIPVVLILASLGGYWISRRALAPVDEITRVARSISVQNLSRRLDVPNTHDELQRMSETWNEVLDRLEGAINRIRQFTADASHELRTPVALIRATAELALRRERTAEEYRKSLREIQAETERMTELTESLLTLARSDAAGVSVQMQPTDLSRLVSEVAAQAEPAAGERGIQLSAQTAEGVQAPANEAALRRVLLILLDNALKHTPPGGRVTVRTVRESSGVSLQVEDTGAGIPPDVLPHIFERFYTGDPVRGARSGAGLGLAIAQAIAIAHHGNLTVESEAGKGARFSLLLKSNPGGATSDNGG